MRNRFRWIGPGFPLEKGLYGYPNLKTDIELVKDSIKQILLTRKGERVMLRNFGSNLHKLIFEPNDELLAELVRVEVEETLREWEPRIEIVEVDTYRQGHEVRIEIAFRVVDTGEQGSTSIGLTI